MNVSDRIPFGWDEAAWQRRQQWMQERGLSWKACPPELTGSLRGLIENPIGQVTLPLALAGPCVIKGTYAQGTYYIPVVTTEGTLCLSMTRGFMVTAESGGIETQHVQQILSRSPIFSFRRLQDVTTFSQWITAQFPLLKQVAETQTDHGILLRIDQYQIHDRLILDFVYTTAEAAGQNMVTFCTYEVCQFIQSQLSHIEFSYLLESNFNSDKNPSTKNLLMGRGHKVIATCTLPASVCQSMLNCEPQQLVEGMRMANYGSALANIVGINLHLANALTAIYLATGQDCACVSENAIGLLDSMYLHDTNSVKVVLTMPSITVGTVGGGTILPQQQVNLGLMNCLGKDSSKRLAELVCASALALEISLGAAIAANEFAQAHLRYGRRRKRRKAHAPI